MSKLNLKNVGDASKKDLEKGEREIRGEEK